MAGSEVEGAGLFSSVHMCRTRELWQRENRRKFVIRAGLMEALEFCCTCTHYLPLFSQGELVYSLASGLRLRDSFSGGVTYIIFPNTSEN